MTSSDTSRRDTLKLLGAGAAITALGTGTAVADGRDGESVVEFERMVGNTLTGSDGAIRGIDAGGLPWVVDEATAELTGDDRLEVEVEGLVLADDPAVPDDLRETNPVPQFRAILSCLTLDGDGRVTENVRTDTAPATEEGDFEIEETVDVPEPCLAPVVLVAGPEEILGRDVWFAVTGV